MKPEWGQKHVCVKCQAHFYDMRKPNPTCPKCETAASPHPVIAPELLIVDEATIQKNMPKKDPLDDFDMPVDEPLDPNSNAVMEDTRDLVGDDDNDMSEVREHIDEGVVDKNT